MSKKIAKPIRDHWERLEILHRNNQLTESQCIDTYECLSELLDSFRKNGTSDLGVLIGHYKVIFKEAFNQSRILPMTISRGLTAKNKERGVALTLADLAFRQLCLAEGEKQLFMSEINYFNSEARRKGGKKTRKARTGEEQSPFEIHKEFWNKWQSGEIDYKNLTAYYIAMNDKTGATEKTIRKHVKIIKGDVPKESFVVTSDDRALWLESVVEGGLAGNKKT